MAVYISHSACDKDFETILETGFEGGSMDWTVNPNVQIGDQVVFYVKKPVMSLVATGFVATEPVIDQNSYSKWQGHTFAKIKDVKLIAPLSLKELQARFPDWGWPRMPLSRVQVPTEYENEFLELLAADRGWDWDNVIWDFDTMSWAAVDSTQVDQVVKSKGAGFGTSENNRLVEEAAIEIIWAWFEGEGWRVVDRQRDNCGYDLLCSRGDEELHVEVKGISGSDTAFIITENEYQTARSDENYLICVVTKAMSNSPVIEDFYHDDILKNLTFKPISYRVTLR